MQHCRGGGVDLVVVLFWVVCLVVWLDQVGWCEVHGVVVGG